jgi:hypothetical protein
MSVHQHHLPGRVGVVVACRAEGGVLGVKAVVL